MRFFQGIGIIALLGSSWLYGVDFTKFSDICEPTAAQKCPNIPKEIRALQQALNADPDLYMYIKTDGKWSKGTKNAIIIFQEHYGIKPASGYVGKHTKRVLQKVMNPTAQKASSAKPSAPASPKQATKSKSNDPAASLDNVTPTNEFVLYSDMCDNSIKGNKCPNKVIEVSNLQILLNADPNLHVNITADGKWGPGTQKAVVEFQKTYHISPAKGYIGLRTKKMLDKVAGAMVAKAAIPVVHADKKSKKSHTKKSHKSSINPTKWKNICEETDTDTCPNETQDVKELQKLLNKTMKMKLTVDGKWGKGTKKAVIKFQKKHDIEPASGYIGPKTKRVMEKILNK